MNICAFESLESRRLLSATLSPLATADAPVPAIVAQTTSYPKILYSYHVKLSNGNTEILKITKQTGSKFSGWSEGTEKDRVTGTLSTDGSFKATITWSGGYTKLTGKFSGKTVKGSAKNYKSNGTFLKSATFTGSR